MLGLALAAISSTSLHAQEDDRQFKRFKGDVSLGYAAPVGSGSNGGFLFAMEPKFAVVDQLAVGLRIEGAITAKFTGNDMYGDPQVDNAKGLASYLATADYYFTNNYSFRPFIGGGVGAFGVVSDENLLDDDPVTSVKFGGMVRIGGEVKHLRFGIEYNLIPSTNVNSYTYDNQGNQITTTSLSKNAYIGFKLGVCFGGGPR